MLTEGFVMLPRRMREYRFWPRKKFSKVEAIVDCYFQASIKRRCASTGDFYLERGDFEASVRYLSMRWGWSLHKTALFLDGLQVDNILIKKRNGLWNGSASVYHIVDYDTYIRKDLSKGNGSGYDQDTVGVRSGYETKKEEGGKGKNSSFATALADFLSSFSPVHQDLINHVIAAVGTTKESGQLTNSETDQLIGEFSRFRPEVMLKACQTYIDQNMSCTGKGAEYLLGIMRRISNNEASLALQTKPTTTKTAGQSAIDRAMAALKKEKNHVIPE